MPGDVKRYRPAGWDKEVVLASDCEALEAKLARVVEVKDEAYAERNRLVAALSTCFPSHLQRHSEEDTEWEDDWRWIVVINLPAGQATWHIHDSEQPWFAHFNPYLRTPWDGHTTEEKYERLAALAEAVGEGERS